MDGTQQPRSVRVDLGVWKPGTGLDVELGPSTAVGDLVDELVHFLGLPTQDRSGHGLRYGLRLDDVVLDDVSSPVPDVGMSEVLALDAVDEVGVVRAFVDDVTHELGLRFHRTVEAEIEEWIGQGRALAMHAVTRARDEIRARITRRIAAAVPDIGSTWRTYFQSHRALRRLAPTRSVDEYQAAVREGLRRAARSLGGPGRVVAAVASGVGAAGTAGVAAVGAAILITGGTTVVVAHQLDDGDTPSTEPTSGAGQSTTEWLFGPGAPDPDVGSEGDIYLDGDGKIWKRSDEWDQTDIVIKGPPGQPGAEGPAGVSGETGAVGPVGAVGLPGARWDVSVSAPDASSGSEGDFHFNECEGVVSRRSAEGWVPLVDVSGTQGPEAPDGCTRTTVQAGQTLWAVVADVCDVDEAADNRNRVIARAVAETWLANLDVIGPDPNQIDVDQSLVVRCA